MTDMDWADKRALEQWNMQPGSAFARELRKAKADGEAEAEKTVAALRDELMVLKILRETELADYKDLKKAYDKLTSTE